MTQPSLVEWHDSRIAEVRLADAKLVIEFEHLVVFFQKSSDTYAVEGWRGRLECTIAGTASLRWSRQSGTRVADGAVTDASGSEVEAGALLQGVDGAAVSLQVEGGGSIAIDKARVLLTLIRKVSDLEEWEGPLR